MLNRLRMKFVGISLTLFGIVLVAFFTVSFNNATKKIEKNSIEILQQLSNNYGKQTSVYTSKSNFIVPPNFTVFLDDKGKIVPSLTVSNPISFAGTSNELLQEFIDVVLKNEYATGILQIQNTSGLRYLIVNQNNNIRVTFMSRILEITEIDNARIVATNNTFYLMILLLITSIFLSIWTFKPVKKAWEEQQQFLADASHELRTPLTAIQANLDVILSTPEKTIAQQAKWIHYIKDEATRMRTLTNDLLFLAKNNLHEKEKGHKVLNYSKIVSRTVLSLESLAFESSKSLEEKIKDNLLILGDENRLKQLIIILIDNAIKYAPSNSTIKIVLAKSNLKSILSITNQTNESVDTTKIFRRFYREDSSRNRQNGGSGLGLSIAKTIVEDHKGRIFAKYQNQNLTISVIFPLAKNRGQN